MNYLLSALMGGIIGYITNWLAIKMLFRPYERKYIFNRIPIPFTPGLIPKEKPRIAKSVGDTVASHLLSEDIIMKNIKNSGLEENIEIVLKEKIERLRQSEKTFEESLEIMLATDYISLNQVLSKKVNKLFVEKLREGEVKKDISLLIYNLLEDIDYKKIINDFNLEPLVLENKKDIEGALEKIILASKGRLERDERLLKEVINPEDLHEILDANMNTILIELKKLVNNKDIEYKLTSLIKEGIELNMNSAFRLFLNPDNLGDKIYEKISDFVNSPECSVRLIPIIELLFSRILEYRIKDLVYIVSYKLDQKMVEKISSKSLDKFIDSQLLDDSNMLLKKFFIEREDYINNYVKELVDDLYEKILVKLEKGILLPYIGEFISNIGRKQLGDMLDFINVGSYENIIKNIKNLIIDSIDRELPRILNRFNISKIVEDEINAFELAFAEEIIMDIAKKELQAITWLGAVLGAIIGIVAPIIF